MQHPSEQIDRNLQLAERALAMPGLDSADIAAITKLLASTLTAWAAGNITHPRDPALAKSYAWLLRVLARLPTVSQEAEQPRLVL